MARPAGFSSDEDYSDNEFSFGDSPPPRKRGWLNIENTSGSEEISKEKQLIKAVKDNNLLTVEELLSKGLVINQECKALSEWDALMEASSEGLIEIISKLLDFGMDPNCHYEFYTPLMAVCNSTKAEENVLLECIELLITRGSNPNAKDQFNTSTLMYAAKQGYTKIVLKLLSLNVNVNDFDNDGWSALFYAVNSGNLSMVKILIYAGGDISLVDKKRRTLHDIAVMKNYKEISLIVCTDIFSLLDNIIEQKWKNSQISSSYQFVLAELPDKKKGRFSGFSLDAVKIIHGIGLSNLKIILEKNIQLGELLTNNDEQWKELGIMSFDRKKIRYNVQKFHERHWGKGSLIGKNDITLFSATKLLGTIVRQFYVLSTTTYYLNSNIKNQTNSVLNNVEQAIKYIDKLEKEIKLHIGLLKKIEKSQNIIPADLITVKPRSFYVTHTIIGFLIFGLISYKLTHIKSLHI